MFKLCVLTRWDFNFCVPAPHCGAGLGTLIFASIVDQKQDKQHVTAKLSRVVGGLESVGEALKLEARRPVPGAERFVEAEGDLELVALLRERYLVVVVHVPVPKDVRCLHISCPLVERGGCYTCQILEQTSAMIVVLTTTTETTTVQVSPWTDWARRKGGGGGP